MNLSRPTLAEAELASAARRNAGVPRIAAGLVLDARAQLGECPRWDEAAGCLYWVDIDRHRLHRFWPHTGENESMAIGQAIGCFAQDEYGGFIAGLRHGYARIERFGGRVWPWLGPAWDPSRARFNDGRCDFQGRFWAGTIWEPRDRPAGAWYRLDPDRRYSVHGEPLMIANALSFSPDGRTMTWADTPSHAIWRCAFDAESGQMGTGTIIRRYDPASGRPDGACVDAEGNIWVAVIQGGRIEKLAPDGRLLAIVEVPVPCPTSCCLGGPDLRTLYITTGRIRMSETELAALPQAGGLYAAKLDHTHAPGLPEAKFKG